MSNVRAQLNEATDTAATVLEETIQDGQTISHVMTISLVLDEEQDNGTVHSSLATFRSTGGTRRDYLAAAVMAERAAKDFAEKAARASD